MMPRDQLVWILEQLPHLQHLSIQELVERQPPCPVLGHQHASSIDDNVLRRLTAPLGCNPTLLPELRGLTVAGVLEFGGDVLLDMVKSRVDLNLESPSHLEFLCVYPEICSTTELDDSTEMQLEDLLGDKFIQPESAIIIRSQRRAMDFKERPQALTYRYQPEFME
uniref:Expressed protein n=2 Tax=Schizophyllum commune (strain H4-8 / FGSC 9210) TaxID=578458 RepID=D8QDG4_SCHCM